LAVVTKLSSLSAFFYFVALVRGGNAYHGARLLAPQSGLPASIARTSDEGVEMPSIRRCVRFAARTLAALVLTLVARWAVASPVDVIFTIDPTQSTGSWSGTDNTYGAFSAQSPGSLSTSVSGNFVVAFDPSTDNPTSIQFVGNNANNNNAYYQLAGNLNGTTAGNEVQFSIQNLIYSLNSGPIAAATTSGLTETFSGTDATSPTGYTVTSGGAVFNTPNGISGNSSNYVGSTGSLTTGLISLSESAAGSGQWTLGFNGTVTYTYDQHEAGYGTGGVFTAAGNLVATANYSVNNQSSVSSAPSGPETVTVQGNSANSAVTATLPTGTTAGTLSVQQVPGITSLTQAAVTAGQNNPVFALSTSNTSIGAPQIWTVQFTGSLGNGLTTLTFDFDPSTIPAGTPLSSLGIWHFDDNPADATYDQWVFLMGPIGVYSGYDTITVTTSSFSPFELGTDINTPEPSTIVLAALGLMPLACFYGRRRKRAALVRG
jgi:hypothetical protein